MQAKTNTFIKNLMLIASIFALSISTNTPYSCDKTPANTNPIASPLKTPIGIVEKSTNGDFLCIKAVRAISFLFIDCS